MSKKKDLLHNKVIYLSTYLKNLDKYEINGNYDSHETSFSYECPDKYKAHIKELVVSVKGNSLYPNNYGNINLGLKNGVKLFYKSKSSDEKHYLLSTDDKSIKSNSDWCSVCFDTKCFKGKGDDLMVWKYSFYKNACNVVLYPGDTIVAVFNDDLSKLSSHNIKLQGYLTKK